MNIFQKFNSKKLIIIFVSAIIISGVAIAGHAQNRQSLTGLISARQIIITPSPAIISTPSPTPTPAWTLPSKIVEAKQLLKDIPLAVGNKNITYTETRYTSVNGKLAPTVKIFNEPEKEIALAILDTVNGEIQVIKTIKRGADLIVPVNSGASDDTNWNITILQRPNGIIWNGWNTVFKINTPENRVVIANVYPDESSLSAQRTIKYHLYVPYSPDLHTTELIKTGQDYTRAIIAQALAELRLAGVKSRSVSGALVADVFAPRQDYFSRIPILEQTDLTEFEIDPQYTIERSQIIIGANLGQAFNATCNSSSACGWVQFTPPTYNTIVKIYPAAKLIKDFKSGAADHLNSMKAAILLYDENLKGLITAHGPKMINDPKLEEYLASSYNGAPRHVYKTLTASILGGIHDWMDALTSKTGGLKIETKGYLVKLRYLQENPTLTMANFLN